MTPEEFNKLTKPEKRVVIAQDVINYINIKKFKPRAGNYVTSIGYSLTGDIQSQFDEIENCHVCALGGCLLSTVKYTNKVKFEDLFYFTSDSDIADTLSSIFSQNQLYLIEKAFEGSGIFVGYDGNQKESDRAKQFYYSHLADTNKRLIAIMENIIKNQGRFRP